MRVGTKRAIACVAWLLVSGSLVGCGLVLDLAPPDPDAGDALDAGGACTPGQVESEPCGRCGQRARVCQPDGAWSVGACEGEAGECTPGEERVVSCAGCSDRAVVCEATCAWPAEVACCTPGEQTVTVDGCPPGEARTVACNAMCEMEGAGCSPLTDLPAIVVPFGGEPSPTRLRITFTTYVALADVYFLFDDSGSMTDELGAIRSTLPGILAARSCASGATCTSRGDCGATEICSRVTGTCVESPALTGCVAVLWTGGGKFSDLYRNLRSLQPDPAATVAALGGPATGGGNEELYLALRALADPASGGASGCTSSSAVGIGCPEFRPRARRLVVAFTDEPSGPMVTAAEAGSALASAGITLIGVDSSELDNGTGDSLGRVLRASSSYSSDGQPLLYVGAGTSVTAAVTAALDEVLVARPQRVGVHVLDDPSDAIDGTSIVLGVDAVTGGACAAGTPMDLDGDGLHEVIDGVVPGGEVCFDVVAEPNTRIPSAEGPQVIPVILEARGDGALLDRRRVALIVP